MSDDAADASEASDQSSDASLGSRLRAAREARELSVEKIADELRIEEHVLHALEDDRLNDIHVAPVFIKGYIKQYGRLLELDYDELREAFDGQTDAEDIRLRPNRSIQLRDERQITIWAIAALAALLVVVALLVWLLGDDSGGVSVSRSSDSDTENVSVAAPLESRAFEQAEQPVTSAAETPPVTVPEEAANIVDAPTTEEPPTPETGEDVSLTAAEVTDVTASIRAPAPGSVEMLFEFSAESWFELTDASGTRLHYDLAEANSALRFMALPPVQVLIGNSDAVMITVSDEAFAVPLSSRRGNVANFVIAAAQD